MKIVRYQEKDKPCYGVLENDEIRPLEGSPYDKITFAAQKPLPLKEARLLTPVEPGKILAVGFNYRDHAIEMKKPLPEEPTLFMKPVTCLTAHGGAIVLPSWLTHQVEYEAELVAVIGKRARNVPEDEAYDYIFGFTCGNDVSARDLQHAGKQWDFCKGHDSFGPVGPWIETAVKGDGLDIQMRVNGEIRQSSNTKQLVFSVPYLVSYLSRWMTLEPGDILFTGTPSGVRPLKAGDVTEVEIEGIGILRNVVEQEKA